MTSNINARGLESAEWQMLLECASPARDDKRLAELTRGVDWTEVLRLAGEHGVLGNVAACVNEQGDNFTPEEIEQLLREHYRARVFASLKMSAELFRVMDRLTAAGVEAMAIKGPALAVQAYTDPAMRTFGDLDLLVRQRDIPRAREVMSAAGYHPEISVAALASGKIPGQFSFRHPDSQMIVEMHNDNTLRYFPRRLPLEKVFQRRVSVMIYGRQVPTPSLEDSLVLICVHGAKHFWNRLMWIADVAGVVERQKQIDWERVSAAAREVGGEHMLHAGLQLAAELLNTPAPGKIAEKIQSDSGATRIARQVITWLPEAANAEPALLQRALFRMRMRGGILAAAGYLLRLSFSPTEDDWSGGAEDKRHWTPDSLRRPLRLARKYGRKR